MEGTGRKSARSNTTRLSLGLIIYFAHGVGHSRLRQGEVVNPEAELPGA
jgi:hypothetical protein